MARARLTQLAVDRMRPASEKRLEVSDHLLPQLRLVLQPSGARSWAVRTRIGGKPAKLTIGDARALDLGAARRKARDLLTDVAEGKDPRVAKRQRKATTLGGVAELYLRDVTAETRPKTQIERKRHLERDWTPLRHRPLADVTRAEIAARQLEIKDNHGPVAANRSRSTLHNLYEWAIGHGLVEANVVASVKRAMKERSRTRVLTLDELREIYTAVAGPGDYNAIVRLLILLGQRREEIGGLCWVELDLERAMWSLPAERTKNRLPHLVPLPRQAVEILQSQKALARARLERERQRSLQLQDERDFLFGTGASPFSGWSRAKKRLDRQILTNRRKKLEERGGDPDEARPLKPWQLQRDIRRSVVTILNDEGLAAPHVVEAVVNHVSGHKGGVAGVYNRAQYLSEKTRALQAWADLVTGVAEGTESKVVALRSMG